MRPLLLLRLLVLTFLLPGLAAAANPEDPIVSLNTQALNAIRVSRTPPPLASYRLAVLHAALHDTASSFDRRFEPYLVRERAPTGASRDAALLAAGHHLLVQLFGSVANPRVFTSDYEAALARIEDGPAREAGIAWGVRVAGQVLASRKGDGLAASAAFQSSEAMGRWRPTPPLFREFTLPQWGNIKPFTLKSCSQFRPPPPPDVRSAAYAVDLEIVKQYGGRDSELRTDDQTFIAAFWSDDLGTATPPGHWNLIAATVSREKNLGVAENARLFALLNLTMADAAIGCWESKFYYGYWRPETAIREAANDDNPGTHPDPEWIPLMPSPTFPDYVSGHSTFSRSAATVLAHVFGRDDIPFSTPGEGLTSAVRSYPGFSAAADEVGMSRVFGGIHFPSANFWGQSQGRAVAEYVCTHYLKPLP
jgi:hypothetical protein